MSHYGVLVLIDLPDVLDEESVKAGVESALERYRDDKWDWYQVGGRWTGHFDGHEPPTGPGTWPTDFPFRAGDCKPAALLTEKDLDVYAVVADGDGWFGGERYEPWREGDASKFVKEELPPLAWLLKDHGDKLAVIVDCHN